MKICHSVQLLLAGVLVIAACSNSPGGDKRAPAEARKTDARSKQAEALIEEAYDLKLEGKNQAALERLQRAHQLLGESKGKTGEAIASNLDDQATVYLRTGDYAKARELYNKALGLLGKGAATDNRLASGIERRKATLDALERRGYHCEEPLVPQADAAKTQDGGASLPYFPDKEAMYKAYAGLADALKPCLDKAKAEKPIPVWTVVLGTGEIVLARTKGAAAGTDSGRCIESTIVEASRQYAPKMPHFRACFRNFTYPFLVAF